MNVIDKLVIELGFDPTEFRKGTTETNKQVDTLTRKVRTASDSMGQAITGLASKFAVAFLGWRGLQEAISLNHSERQMGMIAANTGVAIDKVNALGEALRINVGGGAESAFNALRKITQEQTNLRTTGDTGWNIPLSRFPLDKFKGLLDTLGKARDPMEVFLEVADSLQSIASGPGGRADAFNLGSQLGFDENAVNFLLQGRKAIEGQLAVQEKRYKLTQAEAKQAAKTEASFEQLKITGEHAIMRLLTVLRPFVDNLTTWLDKVANDPAVLKGAADGLKALGEGIQFFVDVVKLAVRGWSEIMDTQFGKAMQEMFGSIATEVHNFVNNVPAKQGEPMGFAPWLFHGGLIGLGETGETATAAVPHVKGLTPFGDYINSKFPVNPAFLAARNGGGGGNNVRIDNITVNTQATDAAGIAATIGPAVRNKLGPDIVKQANRSGGGMR